MFDSTRQKLLGVLGLVLVLAFVQARAIVGQFQEGFRPFGHPPTRVAWSWDMFSVPIERCVMRFDPPIEFSGRRMGSFRSAVRVPFEFDIAMNRVDDYKAVALSLCENKSTSHVQLSCSTPRGPRQDRVDC